MRKLICAAVIAACALVPAGSIAGNFAPQYGGNVEGDPNHYFGFDVMKKNGKRKLTKIFVIHAPVACFDPSSDGRFVMPLRGKIPVNSNGRFRATREFEPAVMRERGIPLLTSIKYTIKGRLLKNRRARGTYKLRFLGPTPCYTGEMSWRARKPAPPLPEP